MGIDQVQSESARLISDRRPFLFFDLALEVEISHGSMLSNARHLPAVRSKGVHFCFIEGLLTLQVADDLLVFPFQSPLNVNHWRANGLALLRFTWWNDGVLHTSLLSLITGADHWILVRINRSQTDDLRHHLIQAQCRHVR